MNFNGTPFFLRALAIDQIERKLYQLLDTLDICISGLDGCYAIYFIQMERMNLNGNNFLKINGTDIARLLGLTIDIITQRTFWIDRRLQRLNIETYNVFIIKYKVNDRTLKVNLIFILY
ncbi:unnamed protein product [Rotaria sp. Silwood1]|nr:unnamed protein product [Rotaria sp. Silwood1]CAF1669159.1 unnamed protein product [Rotaria sp. Silwood1]